MKNSPQRTQSITEKLFKSLRVPLVLCGETSVSFRSCFEFLQKVFLGLMYPFSCVLWAIFWSFPLLFFVR